MMISVIIPVFNKAEYIERCVHTVVSQDFESFEVIVVNDGSTDESPTICNRLAKEYQKVQVFHTPNNGVTAARQYGVKKASGKYVMFVDADDQLPPNSISKLHEAILREDADEVIGTYVTQDGNHKDSGRRGWQDPKGMIVDLLSARIHFCILWGIIFKKELLTGCLDTPRIIRNGEDIMMQIMCLMKQPKVYFIEDIVYRYTEGLPNDRFLNLKEQQAYDIILHKALENDWQCLKPYYHLHQLKLYENFLEEGQYHVFKEYYMNLRPQVDSRVPLQDRIILFLPPRIARYVVTIYRKVILPYIHK